MERIIFHIDVNNAFLSWTAIDLLNKGYKYDIRGSYAVIGGDETARSGIVLAKSMPAKKLGIYTSETLYSARKKCKVLKVYPPNYKLYSEMSHKLFKLLSKYSPDIEIASIDECYMDYGKVKNMYGDEIEFAYKLKQEVKDTLGFTVNIGIANNKLCAKMASDFSKPDKVHTLYEYEIKEKMHPLKIDDLFGVGKKTAPKFHELGIHTIGDLAEADINKLTKYFKNQAINYINMAKGIDNSKVISEESIPDSISNETTLSKDVFNKQELYQYLLALSETVGVRIRKQKKYTTVIAVILKDRYFKRRTHQKKLMNPTNITNEIYEFSKEIFDEMWDGEPVRLIGLRLDGLTDNSYFQTSLFEDSTNREKSEQIDTVIDNLKEKYGYKIIKNAGLVDNKINHKEWKK